MRPPVTCANVFAAQHYGDLQTYHLTADDRIRAVAGFDRAQCLAALEVPGLQKTVEKAVRVRLRKLGAA